MSRRLPGKNSKLGEVARYNIGSGLTVSGGSLISVGSPGASAGKNLLINGDFVVDQRRGDNSAYTSATSPANGDDTFLLDRWILLSDGDNIVDVTQEAVGTSSDIPADGRGAIKLDVETANKKFGIFQPIENKNCKHIDAQVVSASFKIKAGGGGTISNVRIGIIQLGTGSEDSFDSAIVSAWNAAGSDPSLNLGWSYANTPANLALTTSYQTFKVENITMGSLGNVGIFIWVDDDDAEVGEFVFITDVQLEVGETATDFERRPISDQINLCSRYFQKTFEPTTIPVQNEATATFPGAVGVTGTSNGSFHLTWSLRPVMRASPTIVTFNPEAANAEARNNTDNTDTSVTVNLSTKYVRFSSTADATDANDALFIHATAEAEL